MVKHLAIAQKIFRMLLELAGYVAVTVALWHVDWRLGLAAAGAVAWNYGVNR